MPTLEDDKVIIEVTKFASFQTVVGITDLDDLPDGTTFGRVLNTQLTGNKISSLGLGSSPGSTPITIDTFGLTTVGNAPNPAGSGWTARGLDHISVQESTVATGIWGLLGGTDFGVWIGKGGIGGGDYSQRTIDLNSVGIDLLAAKSLNVKTAGSINFEAGGSILADNNADIPITVSGTGKVDITDPALSIGGADYTFPSAVGAASTVLTTDGSNPGVLSWSTFSGVANPLTSNLDVATFSIVSTAGRDLTLDTDGVGTLIFTKGEAQSHRIQFVSTALSAQEVQMRFQNFFTGVTATDGGLIAMSSLGEFIIQNQETGGTNLSLRVNGNGSDINLSNLGAFQTDVIILAVASQESRLVLAPSASTSANKNFQFLTTFASDQLSIGSSTNPDIMKMINTGTVTFTPPAAVTGVLIDQDNDAITFKIDSESTTTKVISIESATVSGNVIDMTGINSITTGSGILFSSTSMTTGQGINVTISTATYSGSGAIVGVVSGVSATGSAILAQHFGSGTSLIVEHRFPTAGRALFVDQDTNDIAIEVDSEATTAVSVSFVFANTSGNGMNIVADSQTAGQAFKVISNSASFTGTGLVLIHVDNPSATGLAFRVRQDGTGDIVNFNDGGATVFKVANGGTTTLAGDLILDDGSNQAFIIQQNSLANVLGFQGQTAGQGTFYRYFTKDGDGTDNNTLQVFAVGSPSSITNRERITFGWSTSNSQFEIESEADGTGTLRAIVIRTEGNTDQFKLGADGSITISTTGSSNILFAMAGIGSQFIMENTSSSGNTFIMRNQANSTANVAIIDFQALNAAAGQETYGRIGASIVSVGAGVEEGKMTFDAMIAGTITTIAQIDTDGLTLPNGVLKIGETGTPSADTNFGKIYTKTDNKIFFQDGAGVEHEIAFV